MAVAHDHYAIGEVAERLDDEVGALVCDQAPHEEEEVAAGAPRGEVLGVHRREQTTSALRPYRAWMRSATAEELAMKRETLFALRRSQRRRAAAETRAAGRTAGGKRSCSEAKSQAYRMGVWQ